MKKLLLLAATAALAFGAGPALAKKQLVIVVKGLDNPFFEAINQGCQKWNGENKDSEYECFYTGPASTSDEAGEAQIVQDMLGKADTVAMAISPSNAKLIAQTIKTAAPTIPIMTLDADLAVEDAALRKTYLGTDNYLMGFKIGEYMKKALPAGGKTCSIQGNPGADNILRRAQGWRDALSGQKDLKELKGEGGWTEVAGCPVFTNDDGAKGVQAMTDILAANPDLSASASWAVGRCSAHRNPTGTCSARWRIFLRGPVSSSLSPISCRRSRPSSPAISSTMPPISSSGRISPVTRQAAR